MNSQEANDIFSEFYDSYIGNVNKDLGFYKSLCSKDDTILEIGCGTGRILQYFLENSFNIYGIDISDNMLSISSKKLSSYINNGKLKLINHNYSKKSLNILFDKVLVTFYTFNYLIEDHEQILFLRHVYNDINEGGKVVISLFYPILYRQNKQKQFIATRDIIMNNCFIKTVTIKKMLRSIEKRIILFYRDNEVKKVETYRKYISKMQIYKNLKNIGFRNIIFFDKDYKKSDGTNTLEMNDKYTVIAEK